MKMDQAELDLRSIFMTLRRRIWLILLLPVLAAVMAGLVSYYVLQPVYASSTSMWVVKDGSGQINYNDLMLSRNLTKTYAEVAKSRAVLSDAMVLANVKDLTVTQLQQMITVTPVRDTEIIQFTIQDGSPERAAALAAAVAEAFKGQIRTFMKVENVAVVDQAQVPTSPVRPRPLMNIAVAFVLGAMAAVGLAFLLEYLDTTLKSPEDVTARLGLPVVGVIPVIDVDRQPEATSRRKGARSQSKTQAVVQK
ncbi:MAG TPA: Wzz/FepE/Etk N-terminal domain-containing protein [Symbiobacteriaceae bacterium]|nr:Wzz/FepE/Etk N-terminal domain-containing protein [Symbiobacteriaceae bacterium]